MVEMELLMDGNGAPDEDDGSGNGKTPQIEVYGCKGMDIESKGIKSIDDVRLGDEDGHPSPRYPIEVRVQSAKKANIYKPKAKITKKAKVIKPKRKGKNKSPASLDDDIDIVGDDDNVNDDDDEVKGTKGKGFKGSFNAAIWDHYYTGVVKNKRKASCKYCGVSAPCHSRRNETSSAKSHFSSCNLNPHNQKSKMRQSLLNFQPNASGSGAAAGPSPYLGKWVFNVDAAIDVMVKKVIVDEDPLCEYEKPGWRMAAPIIFPPYFKLPNRTRLTRLCLAMYEKMRMELKEYFSSTKQRVSLTTDTWTFGNEKLSYMCLTTHYIDVNFKLQKRIISFVHVQSHRGRI